MDKNIGVTGGFIERLDRTRELRRDEGGARDDKGEVVHGSCGVVIFQLGA